MMNEQLRQALLAREAANVKRYHTASIIKEETVGHHSFNVANLLMIMTNGQCPHRLIVAALLHDMGEPKTGDLPSPVKVGLPKEVQDKLEEIEHRALRAIHPYADLDLSEEEGRLLSLADKIDGLLKCREELRMGNKEAIVIGERYISYILSLTDNHETCRYFATECIHAFRKEYLV